MCLPAAAAGAGAAAGAASATSTAISVAGLAISAISTVAGLAQSQAQAQAQANYQARQADLTYQNAQRQAFVANQAKILQHQGQIKAEQASRAAYLNNVQNAQSAANKSYVAEQFKLKEARGAAAAKALNLYAKSIGNQGKVLASGATGQSVGLLVLDAERQPGFATAAESAKLESKVAQAGTQMGLIQDQGQSTINQAFSQLQPFSTAPQLEAEPIGEGTNLGLGIPSYNWDV